MPALDHGTGYIPDVPAPEDLIYSSTGVGIADVVDLRPKFQNAVENQALTSSCSANAAVSNTEFVIALKYGHMPDFSYPELSRRFVYYEGRLADGLHTIDRGSVIRSVVSRMASKGVCEEALFPFFTSSAAMVEVPPAVAYAEAVRHKVTKFERLTTLDTMLDCLARGYPFIFGFQTYSESMRTAGNTGVMPMPAGTRSGGHAVCCVGYRLAQRVFIIRNSWGTNWGDRGYCLMPFDYVTRTDLSSDWWTIQDVLWDIDA